MNILGLTIDTSINITAIGGGILVLLGVYGSFQRTKFRMDGNDEKHEENKGRLDSIEDQISKLTSQLADTNFTMADKYVKTGALEKMESRLREDIRNIEHVIRNIMMAASKRRDE